MHITYDMVKNDMPAIIATRGENFQYHSHEGSGGTCTYVWEGEPDCLIACYLTDLGLPIEAFLGVEGAGVDKLFLDGIMETYGFSADDDALCALSTLQDYQDNEITWGTAYDLTFDSTN